MLFTMCHVPCEFLSASQASASHAVDPRFGNISTILVSNEIGLVATVAYLVERRVFQPIGRQDLDPYPTSSSSVVSYCRPLSRKAEQVRHPSMEDNYEHRRNLLLATERWTYFLLALLDMLTHVVPAVQGSRSGHHERQCSPHLPASNINEDRFISKQVFHAGA